MDVFYILHHWNFPAPEQIEVSISLAMITLFVLWPVRFFLHKVETLNVKKARERQRVILLHVKEGHTAPLRTCMAGECAKLAPQTGTRAQSVAAMLAAEIAQQVHH
jgi:hypothetical protein